ncbi:MAG: RHS repeat-associated core domain-containing protein, partial [Reinekea sp.]
VGQLTTTTQSGLYFVHSDHLGTPKLLTDSDGATVWEQHTTPFGEVTGTVATGIENIQSFPGQYREGETGYSYNYFRDYDPTIGRYLESDPIGLGGGLNTYGYALGNPMRYYDPEGLATAQAFVDGTTYLYKYCYKYPEKCLETTVWAMNLCASVGQGTFFKGNGVVGNGKNFTQASRKRNRKEKKRKEKKRKEKKRKENCQYCQVQLASKPGFLNSYELDHYMAKIYGGDNSDGNAVSSCRKCNNVKRSKTPRDWCSFVNGMCSSLKIDASFRKPRSTR